MTVFFIAFTSCDDIKDLADIEFDATLSTDNMTLTPPYEKNSTFEGYDFNVSNKINPSDDTEIKKYLDKIKDWDINSMEIEIISVSEPNTFLTSGTFVEMKSISGTTANLSFTEDTPITAGMKYTIPPSAFNSVEQILNDKEEFDVTFDGGLNNNATVVLRVHIDVTITANPLE